MNKKDSYSELNIPAQINQLPPTLEFIDHTARECGFEKSDILKIRLALEETLLNIIQHGYPDKPDGRITIISHIMENGIRLSIKDKGIPFCPIRAGIPDDSLGMQLINHAVNKVHYHNRGRQGKEVELIKYLPSTHISRLQGATNNLEARVEEKQKKDIHYSVRRFKSDEALEISRCAYLTYGYSYEEYIYYPDQIISMNDSGQLLSVVAVDDHNNFIGHAAAKKINSNEHLREFGLLLVAPPYRSLGIARHLEKTLTNEVLQTDTKSIFARAITNHVISQKMSVKQGMIPSGILLATFPKNVELKQISGLIEDKMSCLMLWKSIQKPRKRQLFIPEQHKYWVERLYSELNIPWYEGESYNTNSSTSKDQLKASMIDILNIGEIDVENSSTDQIQPILNTIHQLRLERVDAIYLYINLEHPDAPDTIKALEENGCFFAGILPDKFKKADALILQYLNNIQVDYNQIKVIEGSAQELLNYIQELAPIQNNK